MTMMIPCRNLEITLVSATDLPDVRKLGLMRVYAKVSIVGSEATAKTPVDMHGETNPTWNSSVVLIVNESSVELPGAFVSIILYCERTFASDKYVGHVHIPVKSLFDHGIKDDESISYDVVGTEKGKLNIRYSFGEKYWVEMSSTSLKTSNMADLFSHFAEEVVRSFFSS